MSELTATKPARAASSEGVNRIPLSTYRLQLGVDLTLRDVHGLLPYLAQLGVSDLYLSPLFRSRAESSHGYDVVDHGTIDPAIGDMATFEQLAVAAHASGMGILLDVVPNHMGINDPANVWWLDVLENGEGSYFADFFDIDWRPAASALQDRILLPFLADPFGTVLEKGEFRVVYADGRLHLSYGPRRFPLAPPSWIEVLELAAQRFGDVGGNPGTFADWSEFESIITHLRHLPPGSKRDAVSMEERYREQSIVRRRLTELVGNSTAVRGALDAALTQINGEEGNPRSFDQLERLLERQWYRLAYWRVAADEINYRRFFDINDLAAIRVENPRVFDAVHRLVGRLLGSGWVTGLRIDHPDGLRDPQSYFKNLQNLYRSQQSSDHSDAPEVYIVAEKILTGDESLSTDWAVCGTTGYDLMNIVSRVLVHEEGLAELRAYYDRLTRFATKPADVIYESKRAVLFGSMASELQMLAADLYRIAQSHRTSRDFTRPALQRALREVIASMSVYRTYVRGDSWDVNEADYRTVSTAVRMAKRRNRALPISVFDFIMSVLLLENPPTLTDEQALERREFVLNVQQVSGPVTAKGVEDTAFYRYYPLASLNEVGGELDAKPLGAEEFHRLMRHRAATWPHSLSATATHDSKRGEDMRARLHVLSEAPSNWADAFDRWHTMNAGFVRELDGDPVPDANVEYLLYQTLVGTWPEEQLAGAALDTYRDRITQYLEKSLREAKVHTSWMNPSEAYDAAIRDFIADLLGDKGTAFTTDLTSYVERIADSGYVNSLAQLVLKLTLPGVPDFYQGTEFWDFSLVDPDNRRAVDFESRCRSFKTMSSEADKDLRAFASRLAQCWPRPDIKQWVVSRSLSLRRDLPELFSFGDYVPLTVSGVAAEHIIAFARRWEQQCVIVAVPRHFFRLSNARRQRGAAGTPQAEWADTRLLLPSDTAESWHCVLSGLDFTASAAGTEPSLAISDLFKPFPIAILTST